MKIDANDPKWTAYALGEITDPQELAEIEKALEESPELREMVEDIHLTAGLLKEELFAEPAIHLTPAQKEHIEAKASTRKTWFGLKPIWIPVFATAAVLLVVSIFALRQIDGSKSNAPLGQIASVISKEQLSSPIQEPARSIQSDRVADSQAVAASNRRTNAFVPSAAMKKQPASQLAAMAPPPSPSMMEAGSATGTVLQQESIQQLPLASNNVMDLVNVMGGVVKANDPIFANNAQSFAGVAAGNVNIQRDGISANEVRYNSARAERERWTRFGRRNGCWRRLSC